MSENINITVLLFGVCREAVGAEELKLELPVIPNEPANVALAFAELKRQLPQLARFERSALFAINEEHARQNQPLSSGDTLAIFPPVSGG
jgi:molybdopterin synthase catalytic subunit